MCSVPFTGTHDIIIILRPTTVIIVIASDWTGRAHHDNATFSDNTHGQEPQDDGPREYAALQSIQRGCVPLTSYFIFSPENLGGGDDDTTCENRSEFFRFSFVLQVFRPVARTAEGKPDRSRANVHRSKNVVSAIVVVVIGVGDDHCTLHDGVGTRETSAASGPSLDYPMRDTSENALIDETVRDFPCAAESRAEKGSPHARRRERREKGPAAAAVVAGRMGGEEKRAAAAAAAHASKCRGLDTLVVGVLSPRATRARRVVHNHRQTWTR